MIDRLMSHDFDTLADHRFFCLLANHGHAAQACFQGLRSAEPIGENRGQLDPASDPLARHWHRRVQRGDQDIN